MKRQLIAPVVLGGTIKLIVNVWHAVATVNTVMMRKPAQLVISVSTKMLGSAKHAL